MPDDMLSADKFDFSKDAAGFKARLWKKLLAQMAEGLVQELEDDDLELLNAAGTDYFGKTDDFNK